MALPRMRTINQAYEYIRGEDENTSITRNLLRVMCKQGKVTCIQIGNKYLLDLDNLIEKLQNSLEL